MTGRTDSPFRLRVAVGLLLGAIVAAAVAVVAPGPAPNRISPATAGAVAIGLAAIAGTLAGRDRALRESGSARRWVWILTGAGALLLVGEAMLTLATDAQQDAFLSVLLTVPIDLGGPLFLAAVSVLTWPGRLERHERGIVATDTGLGALGLGVIWVAVV